MPGVNRVNDHLDDFPLSPDCWTDGAAYYAAFTQAENLASSLPKNGRDDDRTIYALTRHILQNRSNSDTLFRSSKTIAQAQATVWLSKVRSIAEWFTAATSLPEFSGLEAGILGELAKLSVRRNFSEELQKVLLSHGVILIHERALPSMKVDGASFKLVSGNPVIGISLRYSRLDYYWFTLMHELAHVVMHNEILDSPIMDDLDEAPTTLIERQADRLASDSLIPKNEWRNCPARYTLKEVDLLRFARKIGIAPQIVAGRIRRDLRRHEIFSDLIHEVNMREILLAEA